MLDIGNKLPSRSLRQPAPTPRGDAAGALRRELRDLFAMDFYLADAIRVGDPSGLPDAADPKPVSGPDLCALARHNRRAALDHLARGAASARRQLTFYRADSMSLA